MTGSQTDGAVSNPVASSEAAPVIRVELPTTVSGPVVSSGQRDQQQDQSGEVTYDDLHFGKLSVWSGVEGEVWLYPNEGFHTSTFRGGVVAQGPQSTITMVLAVGQDQNLANNGQYPELNIPASGSRHGTMVGGR